MKFSELVTYFDKIEKISSRNEMISVFVDLFSNANLDEKQIISYLLLGRVAPFFVNSEFNYSEKSLLNSFGGIFNQDMNMLRKEVGDIGDMVFDLYDTNGKNSKLLVTEAYELLWKIVNLEGTGSVEKKSTVVIHTLSQMSGLEAKYFSRIVCKNLRLGASVKTLLDSFSVFLAGDKSDREMLDNAYGVCADVGYIAKLVASDNAKDRLLEVVPTPGVPILSRLVERTKSFEEVIDRMSSSFVIQPKFDGLRLQIHKSEDSFGNMYSERIWSKYMPKESGLGDIFGSKKVDNIRLFTRNLEDVTKMFPEIVEEAVKLKCKSCILDGEVVGWDYDKGVFKSYQDTMVRKRKYSVSSVSKNIPVKSFVFDIMHLDGKTLLLKDLSEREKVLSGVVDSNISRNIVLIETIHNPSMGELKENFDRWVGMGLEGLIAKLDKGSYTPGGRNFEWVKLKRSFMTDLSDSVDVVILGYYKGSGKRKDFGLGALLCGVYNDVEDRFESTTKLGTGISDELFRIILERLDPLIVDKCPKNVLISPSLNPDVYVSPEVVCTIEADDITRSVVDNSKNEVARGLSLRFPRMIEWDRDSLPTDITTVDELEEMFKKK